MCLRKVNRTDRLTKKSGGVKSVRKKRETSRREVEQEG